MKETENLTFEELPRAVSQLAAQLRNIEQLLTSKNEQQSTEQPEQLLTVQKAAKFLNLTVPTIYSKVSKRELPVMKRTKRLYFSETELMNYVKGGRKKTNTEIEAEAASHVTKKWRR